MFFEIMGKILDAETIASGKAIREARRLRRGLWRPHLEEAEGNSHHKVRRWYDVLCRVALVSGARGRSERDQNQAHSGNPMKRNELRFVACIKNKNYAASLELRKLYQVVADETAARLHQIRIIDESGEDYLYPEGYFVPVHLPESAEKAVRRASSLRG